MSAVLANASAIDRPDTDFYPTPPDATQALLHFLKLPINTTVWECACGEGHMSQELIKAGMLVTSSDLRDTGFGEGGVDFLVASDRNCSWVITNPPFNVSEAFIHRASLLPLDGFAFLLKSQYWHASRRLQLFEKYRPSWVLPLSWRPDFLFGKKSSAPTMEVLWTVWKKGDYLTKFQPLKRPVGMNDPMF